MSEVERILCAMREGDFDTAIPRARDLPIEAFAEIASLLERCTDAHDRKLCYWILKKLAISTRSTAIGSDAAKRVDAEGSIKLKLEALEVVMWTDGVTEYESIIALLGQENRDLQRAAICALGGCTGDHAEQALFDAIEKATKPGAAHDAAIALARMCGPSSNEEVQSLFLQVARKKANAGTLASLVFAMARHPCEVSTTLVRKELDSTRFPFLGWACLHYLVRISIGATHPFSGSPSSLSSLGGPVFPVFLAPSS